MWRRRRKSNTLTVDEAQLLIDAAGMIADDLADEMRGAVQTSYGVPAFDGREPGQRLRLLSEVVTSLVDPHASPFTPTVHADGTVFAIMSHVADMVRQEIASELEEGPHPAVDTYSWRRTAWPCLVTDRAGPRNLESTDAALWRAALEALGVRIVSRDLLRLLEQTGGEGQPLKSEQSAAAACSSSHLGSPSADEIRRLWRQLRQFTHIECSGSR